MKLKAIVLAIGVATSASAQANPIQWAGNGHWYEYFSEAVTWQEAFDRANSSSFNGLSGYLATITSAEENMFVSSNIAGGGLAWLGGSDSGAQNVNEWTWRNGPEAGQPFTYTAWNWGEPNNCCGGEDYLHTNWDYVGIWNDHGSPGNAYQMNGYVVEFSAPVPEPETYAMLLAGLGLVGSIARRRSRKQS